MKLPCGGNMRAVSSNDGFSLIETVVVIAIIGILSTIGTLQFNQWLTKNRVEAQVRQMVTDIGQLRLRAITMKTRHSITLNANSYVFKSYSSETFTSAADLLAHGTILPDGTHTVTYPLTTTAGVNFSGTAYEIDTSGMTVIPPPTIFLGGAASSTGGINCLTIHTIRVNAGRQNAGACDDK